MLSHCFLECHEMFQRLVLFLSLNVDGVFLHTTKKFLLVIVFLFCFLLFVLLLHSFTSLLYFWFCFVFYKTKSSLVSLLRFFDLMFLKSCCVFLSVVVFCTFGPPYCSAGQMNNFLLH